MIKSAIFTAEAVPFAKTGGLADVCGALPQALNKSGCDTIVVMPGYEYIFSKFKDIKKISENIKVRLNASTEDSFDIYNTKNECINFYFIRNQKYFGRDYLYGTPDGDYKDNNLRFGFLSKAMPLLLTKINFRPDIVHLHDYHVSLSSLFISEDKSSNKNSFFKDTKVVFTIHNIAYQGIFDKDTLDMLEINYKHFNMDGIEFYGKVNYMKGGIAYSDKITTVSPTYAKEILTPEFGFGLEGILKTRQKDLSGIINGLDYNIWDPDKDRVIFSNYNIENLSGKKECKKYLINNLFGKIDYSKPVLGMVSRLSEQKGLDILANAIKNLCKEDNDDIYIAILGTGDKKYMDLLVELKNNFPNKLNIDLGFSDKRAREIYAGSDIFLMPSKYEPCGLGQLISLKYGTIPVVRQTGGLADTIIDISEENDINNGGQGFKFVNYNWQELYDTIKRSINFFKKNKHWEKIIKNAMSCNFSWDYSAKKYIELFDSII